MNCENISDLIVAILTAVASIVAIFISASVSRKAERENHKRQFLSDAYSNLFTRYARWLDTRDSNDKGALLAAIEQARLLSSPETEKLLETFEHAILHNFKIDEIGEKLSQLRKAMRSELQQPKKKFRKNCASNKASNSR